MQINMNVEYYKNFIMIADYGTLTQASEELHIVQSALSNQVKLLEKEYNASLFIRKSKGLELTEAGKILYPIAKQIAHCEETAHRDIDCLLNGVIGTVRIGLTMAHPDLVLNNILTNFKIAHPRIGYSIFERPSEEIIELLIQNKIDVGFIRQRKAMSPLVRKELVIKQKFHVCCAKGNPWISEDVDKVSIRDLDNIPLAIPRTFENVLRLSFQKFGVNPNITCVSGSRLYTVMLAQAMAGIGIVCISDVKDLAAKDVFVHPLVDIEGEKSGDVSADRHVIVSSEHPLSSATAHFISFCREMIENSHPSS